MTFSSPQDATLVPYRPAAPGTPARPEAASGTYRRPYGQTVLAGSAVPSRAASHAGTAAQAWPPPHSPAPLPERRPRRGRHRGLARPEPPSPSSPPLSSSLPVAAPPQSAPEARSSPRPEEPPTGTPYRLPQRATSPWFDDELPGERTGDIAVWRPGPPGPPRGSLAGIDETPTVVGASLLPAELLTAGAAVPLTAEAYEALLDMRAAAQRFRAAVERSGHLEGPAAWGDVEVRRVS
ncbi:hypothetical protein PS9374_04423 [Planomonospora sphaerica]|uniref:Uncharacterized protein n=1 Tax=Planomonospora sphaerica TaxID=161355 RepID=A0A171DIN9_9ACTN|nr:hypothetical protein PS9374_04423 [Planomonospora sphaerica]